MELVDLPGIQLLPTVNKCSVCTLDLISKYMSKPGTLVLCMVDATMSLDSSLVLSLVVKARKLSDTIVVLTKLDKLRPDLRINYINDILLWPSSCASLGLFDFAHAFHAFILFCHTLGLFILRWPAAMRSPQDIVCQSYLSCALSTPDEFTARCNLLQKLAAQVHFLRWTLIADTFPATSLFATCTCCLSVGPGCP